MKASTLAYPRIGIALAALAVSLAVAALPTCASGAPVFGPDVLLQAAPAAGTVARATAGAAANAAADAVESATDDTPVGKITIGGGSLTMVQTAAYEVPIDTVEEKDLYLWSMKLNVNGTLDGDVIAWVQYGRINGTVTQDVNAFCQELTIDGEVGDDVRVFAQNLTVNGVVRGDAIVLGANVTINDGAVIEGNLIVAGGVATMDGTVMGDASIVGGVLDMNGTVKGDARIIMDGGINLGESARIDGDLEYGGPAEIPIPPEAVGGGISFVQKVKTDFSDLDFLKLPAGIGVLFQIFLFITALIAGLVIISITSDHARRTASTIMHKPLKSLGIGFVAAICMPIVIIIALVLIVTAPLSAMLFLAYLIVLYIAKFYVAIWIGNLILGRRGRDGASPIPGFLLGLPIVYVLVAIPFLGNLFMILAIFLGFGALLQRKETRLDRAFEAPAPPAALDGLPNGFPGSTVKGQ